MGRAKKFYEQETKKVDAAMEEIKRSTKAEIESAGGDEDKVAAAIKATLDELKEVSDNALQGFRSMFDPGDPDTFVTVCGMADYILRACDSYLFDLKINLKAYGLSEKKEAMERLVAEGLIDVQWKQYLLRKEEGVHDLLIVGRAEQVNESIAKLKEKDPTYFHEMAPEGTSGGRSSGYSSGYSSGSKGGCYVATAVYGSYDCPQVWVLRRYRDETLAASWYGRAFVRLYYAVSPTLVRWFGEQDWFKRLWKGKLDRMVQDLQSRGVADTPYQDRAW